MSDPTQAKATAPTYRWQVATSLTISILALLVTLAGPQLWLVIPALVALCFAINAAIKNPDLKSVASGACIVAVIVGGASILLS